MPPKRLKTFKTVNTERIYKISFQCYFNKEL